MLFQRCLPRPSSEPDQAIGHSLWSRYYDLITDFVRPQWQDSQTDFAIGLLQSDEPGAKYQYNQMAMQSMERVLTEATGKPLNDYADEVLWSKINAKYKPPVTW